MDDPHNDMHIAQTQFQHTNTIWLVYFLAYFIICKSHVSKEHGYHAHDEEQAINSLFLELINMANLDDKSEPSQ